MRPDESKVDAIRRYAAPRTPRGVRAFLGLCGWYRRFVRGYAAIALPLTRLTRQNVVFWWGEEENAAFEALKAALVAEPVLRFPDFNRRFILSTDASARALGAILANRYDDGDHPVAYASYQLKGAETRYSACELECYGVVFAVRHFRLYLLGHEFDMYTDHSALKWLLATKDPKPRLARWVIKLAYYAFVVHHIPGSRNQPADSLPRADIMAITQRTD